MFGDASPRVAAGRRRSRRVLAVGARPTLPKNINKRAADVLQPARRQVDKILSTASSIGKPAVRDEVVGLCGTADQIIAELATQPRKLDAARGFLTYYLDAAQRIVDGYVNLARRGRPRGDQPDAGARRGLPQGRPGGLRPPAGERARGSGHGPRQ